MVVYFRQKPSLANVELTWGHTLLRGRSATCRSCKQVLLVCPTSPHASSGTVALCKRAVGCTLTLGVWVPEKKGAYLYFDSTSLNRVRQ